MVQMVKSLPAMWKTGVWSLGWEDPPEKEIATHSRILAWRIPLNRGTWQAIVHGVAESDMVERLTLHFLIWARKNTVDDGADDKSPPKRTLSEVVIQSLLPSGENVDIQGDWHAWEGMEGPYPFPYPLA